MEGLLCSDVRGDDGQEEVSRFLLLILGSPAVLVHAYRISLSRATARCNCGKDCHTGEEGPVLSMASVVNTIAGKLCAGPEWSGNQTVGLVYSFPSFMATRDCWPAITTFFPCISRAASRPRF